MKLALDTILPYLYALSGGIIFGTVFIDVLPHVQGLQHKCEQEHNVRTAFPIAYFLICVGFLLSWFFESNLKVIWRWRQRFPLGRKQVGLKGKTKSNFSLKHLLLINGPVAVCALTFAFVFPLNETVEEVVEIFDLNEYVQDVVAIVAESLVGGLFLYVALVETISRLDGKDPIRHLFVVFSGWLVVVILHLIFGGWKSSGLLPSDRNCLSPNAQQSPIDFGDFVIRRTRLDPRRIVWSNWTQSDIKELEVPAFSRDAHGWQLNFVPEPKSSMTATQLSGNYKPDNVHMHWQFVDNSMARGAGSEHTVKGRRFAAEVHIVFYNDIYGSFKAALAQKNGIAIFGIFVEVGPRSSPEYTKIDSAIRAIGSKGATLPVNDPLVSDINPLNLLPANKDYYSYIGSKTTPPYYTCAQWIVFREPITISQLEYEDLFQFVYSRKNARDLQPVVSQVYSSFRP